MMFGNEKQEATKFVIKEGYQDIHFLNKNGLLGWRKEIVTE